jgi:hypothetical protein
LFFFLFVFFFGFLAAVRDFIAGMTDRYAVRLFEQLFIPQPWALD